MKKQINIKGNVINYAVVNDEDYISLTDIAKSKNSKEPKDVIKNWMRSRSTLEYLALWENFFNPNFKGVEIDPLLAQTGKNDFTMSTSRWIEEFNAIGIRSSAGKHGGTYAHKDIAFKFASWISVEFEFYLVKEFQRLKEQENKELEWSAKRELAKVNYHIHTDVIKEHIVPNLTKQQINYVYASEADVLNVALFGKTASEWRKENPDLKGNIRDYASINQLLVISNLESYNAILIEQNIKQSDRLVMLNTMAKSQLRVLLNTKYSNKLFENKE